MLARVAHFPSWPASDRVVGIVVGFFQIVFVLFSILNRPSLIRTVTGCI